MKLKKFCLIPGLTLLVLGGCVKGFLDVNTNPNSPTNVTPGLILSDAINEMTTQYSATLPEFLGFWLGYWSRSGNYISDRATETYEISPGYSYSEAYWQAIYHINLDLHVVDSLSKADKDPLFRGIAELLNAYNYQSLVDVYNNVPYRQANDINNLTPAYENADTIYLGVISQIDSATQQLQQALNNTQQDAIDAPFDIVYHGNATSWLQLANTIKLRLLLNLSQMPSMNGLITTELAKVTPDGFIQAGGSAMINPGFINSTGKQSPFYGFFGFTPTGAPSANNAYYRVNKYSTNLYVADNDPRGLFFAAPTTSFLTGNPDTISGNFEGDPSALGNTNTSGIGNGLLQSPTASIPLLSDFESLFLQAEAAYRGWIPGNPQDFYQQGITQNFVYLGVPNPATAAQTYYSQTINDVNWTSSPNKLEAIITQKYIAMNGVDMLETWNDYRRLGMPNLPISSNPALTTAQIPVRLLYPQTELDRNGSQVPKLPDGAQFTSKIFWMP